MRTRCLARQLKKPSTRYELASCKWNKSLKLDEARSPVRCGSGLSLSGCTCSTGHRHDAAYAGRVGCDAHAVLRSALARGGSFLSPRSRASRILTRKFESPIYARGCEFQRAAAGQRPRHDLLDHNMAKPVLPRRRNLRPISFAPMYADAVARRIDLPLNDDIAARTGQRAVLRGIGCEFVES